MREVPSTFAQDQGPGAPALAERSLDRTDGDGAASTGVVVRRQR